MVAAVPFHWYSKWSAECHSSFTLQQAKRKQTAMMLRHSRFMRWASSWSNSKMELHLLAQPLLTPSILTLVADQLSSPITLSTIIASSFLKMSVTLYDYVPSISPRWHVNNLSLDQVNRHDNDKKVSHLLSLTHANARTIRSVARLCNTFSWQERQPLG